MFPAIRARIEQAVEKLESELVSQLRVFADVHTDRQQENSKDTDGDAEQIKKAEDALAAGRKVVAEGS